MNQEKVQAL